MEEPNYYAVIPANVRYSKIPANAKLLYGEISALANKEGFCWASDSYFKDLYGVSRQSVNGWIALLKEHGFITIETIRNGKGTFRKIYLVDLHGSKEKVTPVSKKPDKGVSKKPDTNNTSINNTINNNNVGLTPNDLLSLFNELVKTLGFSPTTRFTLNRKRKLVARLKTFTPDELRSAAVGVGADGFLQGDNKSNKRYGNIDYLLRSDELIERWLDNDNKGFTREDMLKYV